MRTIEDYRELFWVDPDKKLKLSKIDAAYSGKHDSEASASAETARYRKKLGKLQHVLYASKSSALLVVLQGPDASGKDGTIGHVMGAFNPQGAVVSSFKVPTEEERLHDFLWRVHPRTPGKGSIAVFNRSHYEDVLVVRVHRQIDKATCRRRYEDIRAFENLQVENQTCVLKFYLHITKEEQLERFRLRLDDPTRNWKISEADYIERQYWDDYRKAYEDALLATTGKKTPWYVIPANHKWFRNLAISQIVADTMEDLHLTYPPPSVDLEKIRSTYHAAERDG